MVLYELLRYGEIVKYIADEIKKKNPNFIPAIPLYSEYSEKWKRFSIFLFSQGERRRKNIQNVMKKYNINFVSPEVLVEALGYNKNKKNEVLHDLVPFYIQRGKFKNVNKLPIYFSYDDALKIAYSYASLKFKSIKKGQNYKFFIVIPLNVNEETIEELLNDNYQIMRDYQLARRPDNMPYVKSGYEHELLFYLLLWLVSQMYKLNAEKTPVFTAGEWLLIRAETEINRGKRGKIIFKSLKEIYIPQEITVFLYKLFDTFKSIEEIQTYIDNAISISKEGNDESDYLIRDDFYKNILEKKIFFVKSLLAGLNRFYKRDINYYSRLKKSIKFLYRFLLIYYMTVMKDELKSYKRLVKFGENMGKIAKNNNEKNWFYELIMTRNKEEFLKVVERFCIKHNLSLSIKVKIKEKENKEEIKEVDVSKILLDENNLDKLKAYVLLGFVKGYIS